MKIVTLMEDTEGENHCAFEHGLSFYIETPKHRLLFDTGASDMTIKNAQKLNIDLHLIDTVVISHGHYDHAGGLMSFCQINDLARIYMHENAGKEYFHGTKYIGIDKQILYLPQLKLLNEDCWLDDELFIFGHITGRKMYAASNFELSKYINGQHIEDNFDHEQCLAVFVDNHKILLSGCAHNGILNILDRYHEIFGFDPDIVVSGFHLQQKIAYDEKDLANIEKLAQALLQRQITFYTGHCTGKVAYEMMKHIMKERLIYIHSGDRII